jgi:Uma2 family endonuclease
VSEAEFLSLPESLDKIELIDGEIIGTPAPGLTHQVLVQRILFALMSWRASSELAVTIGQAPVDVRFAPDRILQPDVFVLFARLPLPHHGVLERVPEICVEVLSTNRTHDRITKRTLYGESGVKEYWIVDPDGAVERWDGPRLSNASDVEGSLTTPLLPGFRLDLRELFWPDSASMR